MDLHLDFIDYKKVFKDREKRLKLINKLSFIPSKPYVKLVYYIKTGHRLNLKNPKTFTEKLNWLKFNDVHPEYSNYVDKAYMKEYISQKYGKEYVIPCLGVFDKYEDIPFNKLPKQFVMKCTHDSGSVQIIKDKDSINHDELKKYYQGRLSIGMYNLGREYPYKNVKPRIIVEELYENDRGTPFSDIKIMCFNGQPKLIYSVIDRGYDDKTAFFDENLQPIGIIDYKKFDDNVKFPKSINRMIEIAKELSKGIRFVRVDFLVDNEKFFFGEMTFFHDGGFVRFKPEEFEELFGTYINTK